VRIPVVLYPQHLILSLTNKDEKITNNILAIELKIYEENNKL
jgi:hypothetical protein